MRTLIQQIIDTRRVQLGPIADELKQVEAFENNVKRIKALYENSGDYGSDKIETFEKILNRTSVLKDKLKILKDRFSRDHIAISAFGKTQDGKSTFWKSLTGINDENILPIGLENGAEDSCTMTKVSYRNMPDSTRKSAEVIYYSKDEFVKMINENLWLAKLRQKDTRTGAIINPINDPRDVMSLGNEIDASIAQARQINNKVLESQLTRLRNYITHYNSYKDILDGVENRKIIELNEVHKYVRRRLRNATTENISYLPVKEVVIELNIDDKLGNIKFIDTRGIGEVALGIEEQLIDTLRYDSDGGLFIRMYVTGKTATTMEHLNISSILKTLNRNVKPWTQFVVNAPISFSKNDEEIIGFFKNNLSGISIFENQTDIIDCKNDPTSVKGLVFRFVQYLANNINEIDQKLREDYRSIYNEIDEFILKLKGFSSPEKAHTKKDTIINKQIGELNKNIGEIADKYYKLRRDNDKDFEGVFDVGKIEIETLLPDLEKKFKELRVQKKSAIEAYIECSDDLRFAFLDRFSKGTTFISKVNKLKEDITNAFIKVGIQLKLKRLDDGVLIIENIEELKITGGLRDLLMSLNNFSIEINSSFLYLLRDSLVRVNKEYYTPDKNNVNKHFEGQTINALSISNNRQGNSGPQPMGAPQPMGSQNSKTNTQTETNNCTFNSLKESFSITKKIFSELFGTEFNKPSLILYGFTDEFLDRLRNYNPCETALKDFFKDNFSVVFEGSPIVQEIERAEKQQIAYEELRKLNRF